MNPWIILILALLAFHLLFILLGRKHFEKLHLSLMGPAILWHTKRGLDFLDSAAERRKFWDVFHPIALALCYTAMLGMIALLILDVYAFIQAPEAVGGMDPRMVLGLPGINPIIPIGYGIIGLIVTLVFHELSHGIVSRHQNITVKSMGLLFFIIPLGAFVEPDDKEIESSEPSKRLRIEEAGAGMNMIVGIVALLRLAVLAGSMVTVSSGVVVANPTGPAAEASMIAGDVITAINGIKVESVEAFRALMESFVPGDIIRVTVLREGVMSGVQVVLGDLGSITGIAENAGKAGMGIIPIDPMIFVEPFAHPFSLGNFVVFLVAPLQQGLPFNEPLLSLYSTPFSPQVFSALANTVYWISWFNLLVGSFNVLPVSVLDGYAIFRDSLLLLGEKLKISKERREKFANTTARAFSWFFGVILLFVIFVSII
jgi:membrane-associated protease RseP (regulator of RpoE activity)